MNGSDNSRQAALLVEIVSVYRHLKDDKPSNQRVVGWVGVVEVSLALVANLLVSKRI